MGGTREGALKAAEKLRKKNPDYFRELAKRPRKTPGGANAPGSFKEGSEAARAAGRKGGYAKAARYKKRNEVSDATSGQPQNGLGAQPESAGGVQSQEGQS